ncbi:MAG: hypothetical protein KBS93_05765, partial [Flavobacteriaceae bacterium]|nr:hypothetical protein [Candidatus Onthonaster equi]
MKKIFYLFLLMMNLTVLAQHPLTRIDPAQLNFTDIPLTPKSTNFKVTLGCGTRNDYNSHAALLYFKADYNLNLLFEIIGQNNFKNYSIIVWKVNDLNGNGQPDEMFISNTTINALRSVYSDHVVKGLNENSLDECEYFSDFGTTDGRVKNLEVNMGEYVVIAIQASLGHTNVSQMFDLNLKIAEERMINKFNYLCAGSPYAYNLIYDEIVTDSGLSDIKLFSD